MFHNYILEKATKTIPEIILPYYAVAVYSIQCNAMIFCELCIYAFHFKAKRKTCEAPIILSQKIVSLLGCDVCQKWTS
jgi:hypothetical protein